MVDRPGEKLSIFLTNHGHFGLFSASLKFERGRPRWILSDSRSTWKIQIVSKRMQNASNVSMRGRADRCTVKLQGTACVSTLTYPLFLQYARGQVLLILPRIGRIRSWEERDQKVSGGLGGVPPWAFRHRSLLKTRLGSSPMAQLPVLPCRTFQAPRKQNSCRWQYKKAPLEPLRYPSPGERLPSSGFLFYHGLDVFSISIRKRSGAWRALL